MNQADAERVRRIRRTPVEEFCCPNPGEALDRLVLQSRQFPGEDHDRESAGDEEGQREPQQQPRPETPPRIRGLFQTREGAHEAEGPRAAVVCMEERRLF